MKRIVVAFVMLSVNLPVTGAAATTPGSVEVTRSIAKMPMAFTANQGQWDQQVMFRANTGGATMWFTSAGATYQFTRRIGTNDNGPFSIVDKRYGMMSVGQEPCAPDISGRQTSRSAPNGTGMDAPQPAVGSDARQERGAPDLQKRSDSVETMAIKASFLGANPNPAMYGVDELEYKCNYFIGNDPNNWHTDVPNYNAVVYEQIYDGIDLKYYGDGKQMEYDFIVSPGADFSQIQYEGAESVSIGDNGELVVTTKWGEVIEQRPVIYQVDNSSRIAVTGMYKLKGDHSFGFELGSDYNPALPLVIDPASSTRYVGRHKTPWNHTYVWGFDLRASSVSGRLVKYTSGWVWRITVHPRS